MSGCNMGDEIGVMGEDTGDCIHCYSYRGLRLCSLTDLVCDENDMDHCINFKRR